MSKSDQIINWAEAVAWTVLIFYLSGESFAAPRTLIALQYWTSVFHLALSEASLESINLIIRKTAHVTEFFILGLLLYRALSGGAVAFRFSLAIWVLAVGGSYAVADELHQVFTRSRTPLFLDSALDFSGVFASQLWLFLRMSISRAGGTTGWVRKLLLFRSQV